MAKQPEFITFTGIDDRTDLTVADQLASQYPIEWGVLFSSNNRDSRFPCRQAVTEIMSIAGMKSAHLCGSFSKAAQAGEFHENVFFGDFDRLQINGIDVDQSHFGELQAKHDVQVIYQRRDKPFDRNGRYLQLYDCSGGNGRFPVTVPELIGHDHLVGYAGGMGPDTVSYYLGMIKGEGIFWIDMEGRLRTNGWFDIQKARQVCEIVFE